MAVHAESGVQDNPCDPVWRKAVCMLMVGIADFLRHCHVRFFETQAAVYSTSAIIGCSKIPLKSCLAAI